jgi:hypothetical protein
LEELVIDSWYLRKIATAAITATRLYIAVTGMAIKFMLEENG